MARWNSFVEFAQEVEFPASAASTPAPAAAAAAPAAPAAPPAPAAPAASAASAAPAPGAPAIPAEAGTVEFPKPVPKRKPGHSLAKTRETLRPTEKTENETEMQVRE